MPLPHGFNLASIGTGLDTPGPFTGISLKTACPLCAEQGKQSPLRSTGGQGNVCGNGHKFDTMEELRLELARVRPPAIKGVATKLVMPGQRKVEVIVKERVWDRLNEKFGERLEATVAAHLAALCEDTIVFAGDDLKMLREGLGERSGNAFELAARAKNMRSEMAEVATHAQSPPASATVMDGPGTFRLKLSEQHTKQVQELARARNIRADEVLKNGIEWNLDSNNF